MVVYGALFRTNLLKRVSNTISFKSTIVRTMSTEDDVIIESVGDKGIITLNRPKALNALNLSMVEKIYPTLLKWENQKVLVIIKGAGGKAFCSGGDIRAIVLAGLKGERLGYNFFRKEYMLNGLIGRYKIPYIAFMDGITMGGGVGLSIHGRYRIATERTLFAMPESAIGLFADVGSSYALPKLEGRLGWYLALTGHRLKGPDVVKAGIATHYCESSKLKELEAGLLECTGEKGINNVLKQFCIRLLPEFSLSPHMEKINTYFSASSVEDILEHLKYDKSEWAQETYKTLMQVSPTSVKVTFKELNLGAKMELEDCLKMEYRMACASLQNHDFFEGVRALLIDKDKQPKWRPKSYLDVTDDIVQKYFQELPPEEELKHKL